MASRASFGVVYARESERVLVFLARRTLDAEVAMDLTAETFAQAWRGWPRVRVESEVEVRALLFTIARRQLARYLRRGRIERRALERLGLLAPMLAEDDLAEIERAAGLGPLRAALAAELEGLGARQREALQLRIVQELSYEEVARRLGVNEPTARARVSRALRSLAAALDLAVITEGEAS
jgi:RNA polymerase sigma factor (sigma-70 family)